MEAMTLKKCFECGQEMVHYRGLDEEGIEFEGSKCLKCGDEVLDLKQAEAYARKLEAAQEVTFSKWGGAMALRIPASMVKALKIKAGEKAKIVQEKNWLKVIPA